MLEYSDELPIITCSTGYSSNTAIALLRLSGFKSIDSLKTFFSVKKFIPRFNHLSKLHNLEGEVLDEVVYSFYPAPHSYTGENVLEISVHGNILNIKRIISLFKNNGFREALPGEFTFRALKNKKLTLSQVEGLDLLLNSNSSLAFNQGLQFLNGELFKSYQRIYEHIIKMKAHLELLIDFSEDIGEEEGKKLFLDSFDQFFTDLKSIHSRVNFSDKNLLQPKIALFGETNAGKSSFFNKILNFNRSIVSSVAGTTRDYVSETLVIEDVAFNLFDTAGLRDTVDQIEEEGIKRAKEIISNSFYKILLINPYETDIEKLKNHLNFEMDLILFTHADLPHFSNEISKFMDLNFNTQNIYFYSDKESIFGPIGPLISKTGPIEPLISKAGPIEPLISKAGPIEPLISKTGPIEPLISKAGPIEPLISKAGPIEPLISKTGPIEPLISKAGPIEPLISKAGPIEPLISKAGPIEPLISKAGPIEPTEFIKVKILNKFHALSDKNPILIERHKECINKIYLSAHDFDCNFRGLGDIAICSSRLNSIETSAKELIGFVSPDDVLNSIFSNFCIGK